MNDNEKEIARINGEARAAGMSYGQFVSRNARKEHARGKAETPGKEEKKRKGR